MKLNNYIALDKEKALKAAIVTAQEMKLTLYFGRSDDTWHVSTAKDIVQEFIAKIEPDGSIEFSDGTKING
jgi:hypothetical protein